MSSIVKFGEDVEGYGIPVLNEREIRAAAGLLFLMMFVACIVLVVFQFNDSFGVKPHALLGR
jgi:hypothetical protein